MPSKVVSTRDWKEKFLSFLNAYLDDLPEPMFLDAELKLWQEWCSMSEEVHTTLTEVLLFADAVTFPNIHTALRIFGTLPVTTCTCERSISTLRRLKTYLRNSISETRLRGLAMLNIHREIELDISEVIDQFAAKHPRHIELVDMLQVNYS